MHIENQWAENAHTIAGNQSHERVHDPEASESRGDLFITRAMRVFSPELGVSGECDVVEFTRSRDGVPVHGHDGLWLSRPVEYKKGRAAASRQDTGQLCCQAMCLESMLCCHVPYGFLYYFESRRRVRVDFDDALRELVRDSLREMHELYARRYTPKVKPRAACRECSLYERCMPGLAKSGSVGKYMDGYMGVEP